MKDLSKERQLVYQGLLELQTEGAKLEAEVKEVTDEGMRKELSY